MVVTDAARRTEKRPTMLELSALSARGASQAGTKGAPLAASRSRSRRCSRRLLPLHSQPLCPEHYNRGTSLILLIVAKLGYSSYWEQRRRRRLVGGHGGSRSLTRPKRRGGVAFLPCGRARSKRGASGLGHFGAVGGAIGESRTFNAVGDHVMLSSSPKSYSVWLNGVSTT
jgi:hypothetical protein